jgi:hypothetical protein
MLSLARYQASKIRQFRHSDFVSDPATVSSSRWIAGEGMAAMCIVQVRLGMRFVETANNVDKAIGERDSARRERRFKQLVARAEEAFQEWLEASDEWAQHAVFCPDCHVDSETLWPAAPLVGAAVVSARTPV